MILPNAFCGGSPCAQAWAALICLFGAPALTAVADLPPDDATLHDITFVDARRGWAVGDHAAIWHTDDGGSSWRRQHAGVTCSLFAVQFLDAQNGWAVGGGTTPYTHGTRGIVLRTSDGGRHWQPMSRLQVPLLRSLRMFDSQHGIAVGRASAQFPSGAMQTFDGGRSWHAVPFGQLALRGHRAWSAGGFVDRRTGLLVGIRGSIARLTAHGLAASGPVDAQQRAVRELRLQRPATAWAVGERGLVLTTKDLGRSWHRPPSLPRGHAALDFDFHAISFRGDDVWMAGSPGTRVFHSPDGGRTWQTYPTGRHTPIHALHFVDARHGWAAGALGAILRTKDGGRTWHSQQPAPARVAALVVAADPKDPPLETIAQLAKVDGYLAVVLANVPDGASGGRSFVGDDPSDRYREAMLDVGACEMLPQDSPAGGASSQTDLAPQSQSAAAGSDAIARQLVRALQTWRPEVVIVAGGEASGTTGDRIRVADVVAAAQSAAENDGSLATAGTGLQPWLAKKVFASTHHARKGMVNIDGGQIAAGSGRTLTELTSRARGLIHSEYADSPTDQGYVLLAEHTHTGRGGKGFFSGLADRSQLAQRRKTAPQAAASLERLQHAAAAPRRLQQLLVHHYPSEAWRRQVMSLVGGLDPQAAADWLEQLATAYRRENRYRMVNVSLQLLVEHYPHAHNADAALVWLAHLACSSEMGHHLGSESPTWVDDNAVQLAQGTGQYDSQVNVASAEQPADTPPRHPASKSRADALAQSFSTMRPLLWAEPSVRVPFAAWQRRHGAEQQAGQFFAGHYQASVGDAWWKIAAAERWIVAPAARAAPIQVKQCLRAATRPHLDGHLSEAFWGDHGTTQAAGGTVLQLAYDDAFLYVALRCPATSDLTTTQGTVKRSRDADLSSHDHVEIRLDVDRDYTTYFSLSVDERGQVRDACWGDASWNPKWYVARHADRSSWSMEAAVPFAALTSAAPRGGEVWAIAAVRRVPGGSEQSWLGASEGPASFGLLRFE